MRSVSGILGVMGIAAMAVAASPASAVVINFDSVDTSGGSVVGTPVVDYLASFGITFSTSQPVEPSIEAYPLSMTVVSAPNLFGVIGLTTFFAYDMTFATPLISFSFTRPGISGAIMSEWSARAYSASGALLSVVNEPLITGPSKTFTLNGPGIAIVAFTDNTERTANLNLKFDNMTLVTTPLPPALLLFLTGLGVMGFLAKRKKAATA